MKETKFKHTEVGMIPNDWEVKKIGELCSITTGSQNTQDHKENGKYPFFVRSQEVERIDKYVFDAEGVVTAGDGVGTGKIFHYVNGKFGLHQRCYLMYEFDRNISAKYFYWIFSVNFYNRVHSMTAKSSVDSVRREMIADMPIALPPIKEQQRIAKALSDVDTLIANLEKLIAKKKNIKQGTMQQLLTGKKRLKGFDGEWCEKKLGQIGEVKMCKRVLKNQTSDNGDIPFYKIGTFGKKADAFISKELYNNLRTQFNYPKKGDILLSAAGTIGRTVVYDGSPSYFQDSNIVWIDNNEKIVTNELLYYIYKTLSWVTESGTIPRIYNGIVSSISFFIPPTLGEQRAISKILSDMDSEIEALEQKLAKMRKIKQGMMQELLTGKIRLV